MKKTLLFLPIVLGLLLVTNVSAAEPTPAGCQPLFNGGNVCSNSNLLSINAKVLKPGVSGQQYNDSDFIENIGSNDTRYNATTPTAFRIYVTNKTKSTLSKVVVKDIFPPRFVTYVSGNGTYDRTSRTFTTTIDSLKAGETKQITLQVVTAKPEELPQDNSSLCTINLALATVNNKTSQDTSQVCLTREAGTQAIAFPSQAKVVPTNPPTSKGGLPVAAVVAPQPGQSTPSTGPESIVLAALLPTGVIGFLLRRKTKSA